MWNKALILLDFPPTLSSPWLSIGSDNDEKPNEVAHNHSNDVVYRSRRIERRGRVRLLVPTAYGLVLVIIVFHRA